MKRQTVFCGNNLISIDLPGETQILSAPRPLEPLNDPDSDIREALKNPLGCPSLAELIKPGMKVLVAFDDPCLPLPQMKNDIRTRIAEILVEELFKLGVSKENMTFICANGLHRKWTERELRAIIGNRIANEFRYGEQLICHDGEDSTNIVNLGKTGNGEDVEVNRAVVDSDITFYLNVNWTSMNGGWKSIAVGLGTYRSIRHHHAPELLLDGSLLDPAHSSLHASIQRIGAVIQKNARIIQIETVLNNNIWTGIPSKLLSLDFPSPRSIKASALLPDSIKNLAMQFVRSSYKPIAINAGSVDDVHRVTLDKLDKQQNVEIEEAFDITVIGLPDISPYSSFSVMNPLLVMNLGLGYIFNFYKSQPFIRKGGVMILLNPCKKRFHQRHHLPYIEFFENVLRETREPVLMRQHFEERFLKNRKYIEAYRRGFSYHPAHPFFVWYWGAKALKHLGMVIIAHSVEPETVKRMGFVPAADIQEALNIARDFLRGQPSIALLKMPPIFAMDVGLSH